MAGILLLLTVSFAATAQATTGLEPGVHADPGSPAAKEYALPLSQGRGTNGKASAGGGSGSAAAFGVGIRPPGARGSSRVGSRGADAAGRRGTLPAAVLSAAGSRAGAGGGSSSILALLVGGVAVLLLGGFVGTVLRRSHHPTASA